MKVKAKKVGRCVVSLGSLEHGDCFYYAHEPSMRLELVRMVISPNVLAVDESQIFFINLSDACIYRNDPHVQVVVVDVEAKAVEKSDG